MSSEQKRARVTIWHQGHPVSTANVRLDRIEAFKKFCEELVAELWTPEPCKVEIDFQI